MKHFVSKVISRLRGAPIEPTIALEPRDAELISQIRQRNLTYLKQIKLASIVASIRGIERDGLSGTFVEAGCALGGSTILIARTKTKARKLFVYDVFEMIPAPSREDGADIHRRYRKIKKGESQGIGGDKYYGYEKDLYQKVQENLRQFGIDERADNVALVKGLVQQTMSIEEPVAFAHIDVDWYEPVRVCLERIVPKLVTGGVLILDDYADWSGCRKATDEYFRGRNAEFEMDDSAASMKITKHG